MIYLLLGEGRDAKDRKIIEIKAKYLTDHSALKLDYESLHGGQLDPLVLKKALISLPAVSKKRLVLIRVANKLDIHNQEIILDFIQSGHSHAVVILDSDGGEGKNSFLTKVKAAAEVVNYGAAQRQKNTFDMTRAIESRDPAGALNILNELMQDGNHPLKLIGGMVWFWGDRKSRLSADQFKKGLEVLQEADLNIKRSRLNPEYAVEIAVTKLANILNPK